MESLSRQIDTDILFTWSETVIHQYKFRRLLARAIPQYTETLRLRRTRLKFVAV